MSGRVFERITHCRSHQKSRRRLRLPPQRTPSTQRTHNWARIPGQSLLGPRDNRTRRHRGTPGLAAPPAVRKSQPRAGVKRPAC